MARHSFWNTQLSIQQTSYSTTTSTTPSSNEDATSDKTFTNVSHDHHDQDPTVITNTPSPTTTYREQESNNIENSKTSPTTSSTSANHEHPATEEHEPNAPKTIHPSPLKPRQNNSSEVYWSPAKELLQSVVKPQSSKKRAPSASTRPAGQPKSGSDVNLTTQHIKLKQSTKTVINTHLFTSMINSSSDEPQLDEDVKTYNQ
jgi:hypothetical protein